MKTESVGWMDAGGLVGKCSQVVDGGMVMLMMVSGQTPGAAKW